MKLTKELSCIKERAINSSYGLRLLRTVSGKREHESSSNELDLSTIKEINPDVLNFDSSLDLGAGRFGTCKTAKFNHYMVCVKTVSDSNERFLREAYFMNKIGGSNNIPYFFGVIKPTKSLVMSCHIISDRSVTVHNALCDSSQLKLEDWDYFVIVMLKTVGFIHNANILHNDIKGDNSVIGISSFSKSEPFLIDFGNACFEAQGKKYELSEEEKKVYQENHFHIAPDLCDGITMQSKKSDVYAVGRLLNYITKRVKTKTCIKEISKICMEYHDYERPTICEVKDYILKSESC